MPAVFLLIGGASPSITGVSWPSEALSYSSISMGFELWAVSLAKRLPRLATAMQAIVMSRSSFFTAHY